MEAKIIAAVRTEEEFSDALLSDVETIFFLAPTIFNTAAAVERAHQNGKRLLLHMDLAEGIGRDKLGLRLVKNMHADGIISTRAGMIKMAKEMGLYTVQRFFLVDSHSVDTVIETVKSAKPDMAEIMPGVVPKVIARIRKETGVAVICGGLIETKEEIKEAFCGGAAAVSIGKKEFWREL